MTEQELAEHEPYEKESMFYGAQFDRDFNDIFNSSDSEGGASENDSEAKA